MRVTQQPAYVLHHYSYRETSLLLELFTRDYGRLGVLAKGARRPSLRQRAPLESFQPLLVSFSGRGELPILSSAELDGDTLFLDGEALYCGFYINELVLRLLHRDDPHETLFDAYGSTLKALQTEKPVEATLRVFEKHLLQEVGYGLVLDHEISNNAPIDPKAMYEYVVDRGPIRMADDQTDRDNKGVRIRGSSLLGLRQEMLTTQEALRETKTLMRVVLARHLHGKPLYSRQLFRNLTQSPVASEPETGVDQARR